MMSAWFITPQEGTVPVGYVDIAGYSTACTGHQSKDIVPGKTYTADQCAQWLSSDIGLAARGVYSCVRPVMTSYQWSAFTSLAFNIGVPAFCKSSIVREANAGNWPGACAAIDLYKYAGGKVVAGLVIRRAKERALCEGKT